MRQRRGRTSKSIMMIKILFFAIVIVSCISFIHNFYKVENPKTKPLVADTKNLLTNFITHQHDTPIMNNTEITLLLEENQNLRQQLKNLSASVGIIHNNEILTAGAALDNVDKSKNIIYGHVHMAKTGGTSLNGMLANKFERVCGHKGYSYDAYKSNEQAKMILAKTGRVESPDGHYNRDRVNPSTMAQIGYEDCDYVSHEDSASYWTMNFAHGKFHGIHMELHIPCREPIDHLLSQCNFYQIELDCSVSSNEFFKSVNRCFVFLNRFSKNLENNFDSIKCYDFREQFTTYIDYMGERLQERRLVSEPYIKRDTNEPRNKTKECLWQHPDLISSTREYLLKLDYYKFCDSCIGSENDITSR